MGLQNLLGSSGKPTTTCRYPARPVRAHPRNLIPFCLHTTARRRRPSTPPRSSTQRRHPTPPLRLAPPLNGAAHSLRLAPPRNGPAPPVRLRLRAGSGEPRVLDLDLVLAAVATCLLLFPVARASPPLRRASPRRAPPVHQSIEGRLRLL
ncbi:hypothetical protein PVAP13_5NG478786 [Panicum virgatum]|uniref:Uncharacterized protein n=1 Tax=Panicum virgatum TaxID=38727 RepID=A0A8T0RZN1_PANVG|nr:hypothetical protein PVAP13_5NG478786 [Panicum virgatum]